MPSLVLICDVLNALAFCQDWLACLSESICSLLKAWEGVVDEIAEMFCECREGRSELLLGVVNVDEGIGLRDAEL